MGKRWELGALERTLDFAVYSGVRRLDGSRSVEDDGIEVERHLIRYPEHGVIETWLTIRNTGKDDVVIDRVDSVVLELPAEEWRAMYYSSDWGVEFEPCEHQLVEPLLVESRFGRSSKGMHPWLTLFGGGQLLTVTPMWSGNWAIRCEPSAEGDGRWTLSAGLHDWEFRKVLAPGSSMESICVALALGDGDDGSLSVNRTSIALAEVGRRHWYPRNELSQQLPAEWNHWWSYEDKIIDEETFRANAEAAEALGLEICTLDAGWFGPTSTDAHWYDYRGDWDKVNTTRFPSGIRALSDDVHSRGMKFGLWCEIEAIGVKSDLAREHPEYMACGEGGKPLGYLCLGNPAAQEWAFLTLDRLITEYRCDWIKLDFNLDPCGGCKRTDHGHGAGDGLFEHYNGYYRVLDRIREKHPGVLLENCSSGGLRIDLGMMRHTHMTFLSDPDWPEHSLQVFWGASTMLAPEACLHWTYSHWLGDHAQQKFNPHSPDLTMDQFDYYTRIAMLHGFGLSQKLPELPERLTERLALHVRDYKQVAKPFIRSAQLYRLTEQPKRIGGDRWAAFQFRLAETDEHLVFAFRLPGGETERSIRLWDLEPARRYSVQPLSVNQGADWTPLADNAAAPSGQQLMQQGLRFAGWPERSSAMFLIRPE
jgi:alpha-galactosidase